MPAAISRDAADVQTHHSSQAACTTLTQEKVNFTFKRSSGAGSANDDGYALIATEVYTSDRSPQLKLHMHKARDA